MIKRNWIGACLLACVGAVTAGNGASMGGIQVEASVLVTGTIDIGADGIVTGHVLDHPEKLDAGAIGLVERTLPGWRFEPVLEDGQPHKATATMSLLLVANKIDAEHFTVRIRSAHFDDAVEVAGATVSSDKLAPPKYPKEAYVYGVGGTAYLVIRVGHDGRVTDVAVEQVNLSNIGTRAQMEEWRDAFALASRKAARQWHFNPPTVGKHVNAPYWSVRIPVAYRISSSGSSGAPEYGHWEPYVPGPKQPAPWLDSAGKDVASSPEALAAGAVYQVGEGLKLLTPLEQA